MVQVDGMRFALQGKPFCAVGFNAYYLGFCSDATQLSVLRQGKACGVNTIRAWAFHDVDRVSQTPSAFQTFLNREVTRNESSAGLCRLDALIAHAEQLGVFLILPLINGWNDFGGMPLYARAFGCGSSSDAFFGCEAALAAYDTWVEKLLTRRNTITGRLYLDEPSVLAWELANEPRHTGGTTSAQLYDWVARSAQTIKQLDPSHLLAVGDEGFFSQPVSPLRLMTTSRHLYDGRYGVDAEALLRLDAIDFGTYHLYPATWGVNPGFGVRWIREHLQLASQVGKPFLLEEFGLPEDCPGRLDHYAEWFHLACDRSAGALLWMVGCTTADSGGFRDRYTLQAFPADILDSKSIRQI